MFPKVVFNIKYVFLIIWLVMKNELIDNQRKIDHSQGYADDILSTFDRARIEYEKSCVF